MISNRTTTLKYPNPFEDVLDDMVDIGNPCFVFGEGGRSTLIKSRYSDVKIYDSREILEIKNLAGFYAVKENELVYAPGVLIEAMQNGEKICFKNIEYNLNLLHYLRPVINNRTLLATNGNLIKAEERFRIFFTCREVLDVRNVAFIGPIAFTFEEALQCFEESIREDIAKAIAFSLNNKKLSCPRDNGFECDGICWKNSDNCQCYVSGQMCKSHFKQLLELKRLFSHCVDKGLKGSSIRQGLYQCIVNVFLRHESRQLCEMLMIILPPLVLPDMLFAKTAPVENALRSMILNISMRRPTLLVGETGAGKTALVQYLCKNAEHFFGYRVQLKTINMSSDFDGSDLIGGYHSIDFDKRIKDLYLRAKLEMPRLLNKQAILQHLLVQGRCSAPLIGEIQLCMKILDKKIPFYFKEGILTDAMKNGSWILLDEVNLCSEETLGLLEAVLSKDEMVLFESGDSKPVKIHPNFMIFACMNPHGDFGKKRYESAAFNRVFFYDFSTRLQCIRAVVQSITRNLIKEVEPISSFYYEFKLALSRNEYSNIIQPLISGRTLCRALSLILEHRNDSNAIFKAFNLLFFTQLNLSSRALAISLFKKFFGAPPADMRFTDTTQIDGFIITPQVRIHLADIDLAVYAKLPVLLQGDTSTGKTSLIYALAKQNRRRIIRINNHSQTESSDYLGSYVTTGAGIQFKYGPIITAMQKGYWVILDELNLAPSDVLEVLNRLLDDNRELYVPETNETIVPHPNFRLFATQNINYGGRHGLAKSFRNRFIEIFFYEKDDTEIAEILERSCRMPKSFIKYMMAVFVTLKTQRSLDSLITLRDLFKWARRMPSSYYELYEIGLDILMIRQRSLMDRRQILDVFTKVFYERFSIEKMNFQEVYYMNGDGMEDGSQEGYKGKEYVAVITQWLKGNNLILTRSYVKLIDLIYKAWKNNEPILLIGETGIGKTKLCELVSLIFGSSLKGVNVHAGTESADFIGHSVLDSGNVIWKNGPLTEAMINGDAFLIDEINLADDATLERLNSVLEDGRTLFIPELDWEISAHSGFKVVATMNPSGDFGKRELSPALRSRFTEIYFEIDSEERRSIFEGMLSRLGLDTSSLDFYRSRFDDISDLSVRKIELVCAHIRNILSGKNESGIVVVEEFDSPNAIWEDCLEVLGRGTPRDTNKYIENEELFGVYPYYLKRMSSVPSKKLYSFHARTAQVNLQRIIRGLTLGRGVLLEGEPGVGKTSIIQHISSQVEIPVLRINLSEQTEMSDLLGSYVPRGDTIFFAESEMVKHLRDGHWVILDEINLCTQSVIEGLNSILDHRGRVDVNGSELIVHKNARIFGTMNPHNRDNGRKMLPKSFIDRFVFLSMATYNREDLRSILLLKYGPKFLFDPCLSLRGNIKMNVLSLINNPNPPVYSFENNLGKLTDLEFNFYALPIDYAIPHSQVPQLEVLMRCLIRHVPVILCGSIGRNSLLRFLSSILSLNLIQVDCHKDTDVCDLLGQYQKTEIDSDSTVLFQWKDSILVNALKEESLIVFNTPEVVDKSVFDRLNSLFEGEKSINIYEKGYETLYKVGTACRFILCCENPHALSPALLDRCQLIRLSDKYSYIDLYKIFSSIRQEPILGTVKYTASGVFRNMSNLVSDIPCSSLDLDIKRFRARGILPPYLNIHLGISNTLIESKITEMFTLPLEKTIPIDKSLLDSYKLISSYSVKLPSNYSECIDILCTHPTTITLIKAGADRINEKVNCKDFPITLFNFKLRFIKDVSQMTLADLPVILYASKNFKRIQEIECIKFDSCLFSRLTNNQDPLLLIRNELFNQKVHVENELKMKISETAKSIYKYGRGDLGSIIEELDTQSRHYQNILCAIDKRLKRNYPAFLSIIKNVTLCDYLNNNEIRTALEEFSDIGDYFLASLLESRDSCLRCNYPGMEESHSSRQCSLRLIRTSVCKEMCMKPEFSKFLFDTFMQNSHKTSGIVFEAIAFNEQLPELRQDSETYSPLSFTEEELDDCIACILPERTVAQAIENRKNTLILGADVAPLLEFNTAPGQILHSISSMSILSTPEDVINQLHLIASQTENLVNTPLSEKYAEYTSVVGKLTAIESFFTGLYKMPSCLVADRWYMYFQKLLFSEYTAESIERFFLDTRAFEFLDRLYFAEKLLSRKFSLILYNYTLLYKVFDIKSIYDEKLKSARIKLIKEPRYYEKTIQEFLGQFMYVPTMKLARITFDSPGCQEIHPSKGPSFLLDFVADLTLCECQKWIELVKTLSKEKLIEMFSRRTTREDFLAYYLKRPVEEPFSFNEICLAKLVSNVVCNLNKMKYQEDHAAAVLGLCHYGIEYPFPPYLYFVYCFSNSFADNNDCEYESGVGLHDGRGRTDIEDKIEEGDINNEQQEDKQENLGNEGVDMNNDGEMHSAEEEGEEGESGVDDKSIEGSEETNDEEERGIQEKDEISQEGERDENEGIKEERSEEERSEEEEGEEEEGEEEGASDETSEREASSASLSDTLSDSPSDNNEDINKESLQTYKWNEAALNHTQTCVSADGYTNKVEGGNLEEKDALEEGEGDKLIEGEGETGQGGIQCDKTATFNIIPSDCTRLANLLRIILESNRNNKYKGDFKTGKKLNLRKIIPYIASDYRKDKIWMKRQRSEKKEYILRIFIDNSKSMNEQNLVDVLSAIYYKLEMSFSLLNIPVQLYKFGTVLQECTIDQLTFNEDATVLDWADQFHDGINIILTDGVFQNLGYAKDNFLVVMLDRGNIRKMSKVTLIDNKVFVKKYLDSFPLKYCVVDSIDDLERTFVDCLASVIKNAI
ncbi:hypothetical protein GINT2_001118 [Glugoides intestinalis]